MSRIVFAGTGAVSPAGWTVTALEQSAVAATPLPHETIARPGWPEGLAIRRVPALAPPPAWMRHPRMRRVSPIARYTTVAALAALGEHAAAVADGSLRLGVVYCVMAGCVNYSARFYREVIVDPATASPLVFAETVFNAPASHLAALLGVPLINYTLVADDTALVQGLATAAGWLADDRIDACLVIGAEEVDWLTADALHLFNRTAITTEGAGAVLLTANGEGPELKAISSPCHYLAGITREMAAENVHAELDTLCPRANSRERINIRTVLGEGFNAATAWQTVLALEAIKRGETSTGRVVIAGANLAATGLLVGR